MRAITIMLLLITLPAFAAQDRPKEHEHPDPATTATADAKAGGGAGGAGGKGGEAAAEVGLGDVGSESRVDIGPTDIKTEISNQSAAGGGEASADNAGVSFDSTNETNFFAFSTGFPQANGCFGGFQSGGSSRGGAGFLGFHWLNDDCWKDQMANAERHVDMRARLKCSGKKFRNAIAYDTKGRRIAKTTACIEYATKIWKQQIDYLAHQVKDAVDNGALEVVEKK